ncbi:hypothetical protein QE152_g1139 [Popillia japonica]|uniref:Double jelly roll-like domain-containing protein n=1 Tax=Popillia japonica TaxID=7064 RepID=A0AAW1N9M6_POPJA
MSNTFTLTGYKSELSETINPPIELDPKYDYSLRLLSFHSYNTIAIDRCIKPGITTTMKSYISLNDNESRSLEMSGWCPFADEQPTISNTKKFNVCIPLKFLFGFAEDYNKIIMNVSHELILVRSKTDDNCYKNNAGTGTNKGKITIDKIEWHVPHTKKKDNFKEDATSFDHSNIENITLY